MDPSPRRETYVEIALQSARTRPVQRPSACRPTDTPLLINSLRNAADTGRSALVGGRPGTRPRRVPDRRVGGRVEAAARSGPRATSAERQRRDPPLTAGQRIGTAASAAAPVHIEPNGSGGAWAPSVGRATSELIAARHHDEPIRGTSRQAGRVRRLVGLGCWEKNFEKK